MSDTKLVEPKFEMSAFMSTVARTDKYTRIDGEVFSMFFDAADNAIAMGIGPGPYFMQFFPFAHITEMLAYNKAKFESEEVERLEREAKAESKRREAEAAQAEKDARRLAMKALHAKPE